ncbi:MAG: hypothetical protein IIB81_01850 [Nanoarchaeota archaeon]|nr:hypothetical protein [Nanoarchaeota archaeon]
MGNKYWFRPKKYGYGATPSSWEGWLVTLFFILLIISRTFQLQNNAPRFVIELILIIIILVMILRYKTEGKWRWGWGK